MIETQMRAIALEDGPLLLFHECDVLAAFAAPLPSHLARMLLDTCATFAAREMTNPNPSGPLQVDRIDALLAYRTRCGKRGAKQVGPSTNVRVSLCHEKLIAGKQELKEASGIERASRGDTIAEGPPAAPSHLTSHRTSYTVQCTPRM